MKRPLLLRILPDRLRMSACSRVYRGKHARWIPLYREAELQYAPEVCMELVPGDLISDFIAFTGIYEPTRTRRVVQLARTGGTFIDVGANLGYFALLWAAANPENRCFAFEASPRNIDLLRANVRRNGFETRIQVIPHAAGRSAGRLRFDPGPADQTGWGGFAASGMAGGIDVDVVRVDDIVPIPERVALLKVDIEGADAWALMGCERLLKAGSVREVWFEENRSRMRALGILEQAAADYLRSLGYRLRPFGAVSEDFVEWSATLE